MAKKLTGRSLAQFEAKRDVWQEVLDSVHEIKAGGGKRVTVEPRSPTARRVCNPVSRKHSSRVYWGSPNGRWSNGSKAAVSRVGRRRR